MSLVIVAYLEVFGSWVAFSAYVWLLRVAPTPLVAIYADVNLIVAIVLGHVMAGQPLGYRTLVATVIIMGSVIFTSPSAHISSRRPVMPAEPVDPTRSSIPAHSDPDGQA